MRKARWSCGVVLALALAAVLGCGQSTSSPGDGGAGSSSRFRPATAAEVDAMYKSWCDWDVRCDSDYPLDNCAERRASNKKPELYAAGPMADLATCFATLSCDAYEDRCVEPVAAAVAQSTPRRADFLASCSARADACTGEGELSPLTCYWLTLFADPVFPQVEACVAKTCEENMSCVYALSR